MKLHSLESRHTETLTELERYRLLVESVEDYAIFLLDPDGYVLTWNKGAEQNKGYKPEEIIGKHFSTFYLEHDKQAHKPEHELELAKKFGRVEDEDWRMRKDGSHFWANVVITALYDKNHDLIGFAKVTRNLTERKRHEDELRRANAILLEQQAELQRLNVAKDEFISLASHQLRTPATGIKQFLGMLLEGFRGQLTPDQLVCVQRAYDSNEHQIAIVNALLRVAQLDAGKVVLHKTSVDLKRLVTVVLGEQEDIFRARKQKIIVDVPNIIIHADSEYFRMVVENITDNASKYTPQGGTITISAKESSEGIKLVVKDTGVGIEQADADKLFEKFTRLQNALSDRVGGSGLGLYWASKVVALHDGRIEMQSKVGKGTTFTISLPVA